MSTMGSNEAGAAGTSVPGAPPPTPPVSGASAAGTRPRGAPGSAGIVTPEAVLLEFDSAGVASRVIAELIDLAVMFAGLMALLFGSSVLASIGSTGSLLFVIVMIVAVFLIFVGYPVAMESLWNGRSLGKAAMGLRVVTQEGAPIRFRHAAIRGIFGVVEIYAFTGAIAVTAILFSKRSQRIGDMVAGTIVVSERSAGGTPQAVSFRPPWGYEAYAAALDVSGLTPDQYGIIRSFLLRVNQLTPHARQSVAHRLANPVAIRMHHSPPLTVTPEAFLLCVAAAYQLRRS